MQEGYAMRRSRQSPIGPRCRTTRRNRQRRVRVRRRERTLLSRAPARTLGLLVGTVAVLTIAAATTGYVLAGAISIAVAILAWLTLALRLTRLEPAGPRGDGPTSPGGAGVREPRRPLPLAPAGAAAMPLPVE
jgi:hypothetical protein